MSSTTMLLIAAARTAQWHLESRLAEHDVTMRHLAALAHLTHTPGPTYSDVARRLHVTPQSMQATMNQLTDRGAITTQVRGRAAYPQLTKHGQHLLTLAANIAAELDHVLTPAIRHRKTLHATLDAIARSPN